jgi:arylsulfatase A-like enzyme
MKKQFQIAGLLISCLALVYCIKAAKNGPDKARAVKPNVIFILTDQWRGEAVGYAGNKDVKTPNIDRLAGQSVVFKNAVSTMSVCTPYRGSLLTGQYPLKHGLFYNDKPLTNEALTMAEIYKEQGYRTGYIGKWHVNGHKNGEAAFAARDRPVPRDRRQGFDYWKVREVSHDYNDSFYFDENDQKHTWPGYDAFPQADSAIGFIKNSKDPFLLVLSVGPPHNPYNTAPEKYKKMYDPAKLKVRPNVPREMQDSARKVLAQYYAHCTALDDMVGSIMKTLEDQGIADNTIVVFTSDHGDMLLTRGVFRKQRPWDESILVPMLIRYPAKLGKKSIAINKPIGTPDILPTLLGLSGIKIPDSIDGTDVSQGMLQPNQYPIDAALIMLVVPFHEYNFTNGGREYRGIRTERYTYARKLNGPWLLYDNKTDPYQQENLVDKPAYKDLQASLEATLSKKLKENNDQFLPADAYMKLWNYTYDNKDSLRPQSYYAEMGK